MGESWDTVRSSIVFFEQTVDSANADAVQPESDSLPLPTKRKFLAPTDGFHTDLRSS